MEVTLAVLADFGSVQPDGKLNIVGVFQEINPPVMPFILPLMFLVVAFETSADEIGTEQAIQFRLIDSEGTATLELDQMMTVPQPPRPGRVFLQGVIGLHGTRFERAGDYQFSVLVNGVEKRSIPFRVNDLPVAAPGDPE